MRDEYTCRLTLAGPPGDIDRFQRECISVFNAASNRPVSFDFEAPVPNAFEPTAAEGNGSDQTSASTDTVTDREQWCSSLSSYWGTQRDTWAFRGKLLDKATYDCTFMTDDPSIFSIFDAFAQRYPGLEGTFVATGFGCEYCTVGVVRNGEFNSSDGRHYPLVLLLVQSFSWSRSGQIKSARALLSAATDYVVFDDPSKAADADPDHVTWTQRVFVKFCQSLDRNLARHLILEGIVLDIHDHLGNVQCNTGRHELKRYDEEMDPYDRPSWAPEHEEFVAFLRKQHCFRTPVERQLTRMLVAGMRENAFLNHDHQPIMLPCSWFGHDELCDWASLTLSRPDAPYNSVDDALLHEHLRVRAERIAHGINVHLYGSESGSPVVIFYRRSWCSAFRYPATVFTMQTSRGR